MHLPIATLHVDACCLARTLKLHAPDCVAWAMSAVAANLSAWPSLTSLEEAFSTLYGERDVWFMCCTSMLPRLCCTHITLFLCTQYDSLLLSALCLTVLDVFCCLLDNCCSSPQPASALQCSCSVRAVVLSQCTLLALEAQTSRLSKSIYCRAGIDMASVEVRMDQLKVEANVAVGSRGNPTVTNSVLNIAEVTLQLLPSSVHAQ